MAITKERLQELLARARAAKASVEPTVIIGIDEEPSIPELQTAATTFGMHGESITYNTKQGEFISLALSGVDCILVGAAGTGKSTCQRGVVTELIQSGVAGILKDDGHKHLPSGTPGILICAYTRRAVNNIRKVLTADMQNNCLTIHKLLEFKPVYYEVMDEATGNMRNTMSFEATRTHMNPLDASIQTIIFEESSMISTELFALLEAALPHKVQYVFIGDIQQLPPVFGSAILGYKMLQLPMVELTEVYRQALESPIIRLAHRILSGVPIPASEYGEWEVPQKLKLHPWKKQISEDLGILTIAKFFKVAVDSGDYIPEKDFILLPFNKSFGTDELNKHIAQHLTTTRKEKTYEIVAGFQKQYLAVGDKVMYDKEDAVITSIAINGFYIGGGFKEASTLLDRWGNMRAPTELDDISVHNTDATAKHTLDMADIDAILERMASDDNNEDAKREASHIITLELVESGEEVTINSARAVNNLLLSYALTTHKAQGSEARKVFVIIHHSHAMMIQREWLYTAVTRARESLYVICTPDTFTKGILNQRIKGNTLEAKAEFFKGKIAAKEKQPS
jgi:exodeoxyribonuclease V alpha subunit